MWINIHLPSGRSTCLWASESSRISDLLLTAGHQLGVCIGSFITSNGHLLQSATRAEEALKCGDSLTAVVQSSKVASCDSAFVLIQTDGSVMVLGGKKDWVRPKQLQNVQEAGFASVINMFPLFTSCFRL